VTFVGGNRLREDFLMRSDMSRGQVAKNTLSMASIHVEGTGKKADLWRKSARLAMVTRKYVLLICGSAG